ncbi:enolase C-terminal domain-like protein [Aporhodopirellula aestuarii]|uniref:Dipeptide epimerase n=1 Tax=Aporhodopirellula aestuarii TaxID=2950107 RepID=A0ABT0TX28_9BACT|nr:enolase C-terminal domain-like protein [Aporhodopirellula aestuarii]MCM2369156.1 dipeptide epimerase [Aporhodopirellula aestuarii]
MRISELTGMIVRLRLRKEFKHASFSRSWSDNFIVRCRLDDGTVGWGEGIPRTYVTGESPEGAMEQLAATNLSQQLAADCKTWHDVIEMCEGYHPVVHDKNPRGCLANAHRCAVELSILDAYGKAFESPLSDVTQQLPIAQPIHQKSDWVQYSSAISTGRPRKEMLSSLAMRIYGFRHCKVKVAMQPDRDALRLKRMRRYVGRKMDLRVDANEAWCPAEVSSRIEELEPYGVSCAEQPVHHADVETLAAVRKQVRTPLMLDESLTSEFDAARAIENETCDLFNIRLSKCGGFISSLKLAAMAHNAGLGYQLGCHPGESGILSAAGRHFATSVTAIRYREGSADRHLLKDSIINESITFGRGGWAPAITAPGLGITVDEQALSRFVLQNRCFSIA